MQKKNPTRFNGHNHHPLISYLLLISLQRDREIPSSDQGSSLEWVHRGRQEGKEQTLTFLTAHKDFSCGLQSVLGLASLIQGHQFPCGGNMLFHYLQQKKNYLNTSKWIIKVKMATLRVLQAQMKTPATIKSPSCSDDKHRSIKTDELSHIESCVSGDDFRKISHSDPYS